MTNVSGSMSTARTPSDRGRPELTTQRYSHGAQIKQEPVEEAWNPAFASTPANLQRYINTRKFSMTSVMGEKRR